MSTYLEQSVAKLEEFEGCIPWMYRDTVGKVTTGVGLMLPDVSAAQKLPFQLEARPATEAEIAEEFARVDALPMGRPALFYRHAAPAAVPELTPSEMNSVLRTVLLGFEQDLRAGISGYDGLPDAVKLALLDMSYNLGPERLLREYTRLLTAIAAADWSLAAETCSRRGPGAARNEWTRQQFLSLAQAIGTIKAAAASAGLLKDLGFGLVGIAAEFRSAFVRWFNTPR